MLSCVCTCVCLFVCVCAVRPVRMHMDLDSNMRMVGKRYPYYAKYTVSFVNVYKVCAWVTFCLPSIFIAFDMVCCS